MADFQKKDIEMHWREMNCYANSEIVACIPPDSFYISSKPPLEYVCPSGLECRIYHPRTLNGITADPFSDNLKFKLETFIGDNYHMNENTLQLTPDCLQRILAVPCFIALLLRNDTIIGCVISIVLRCGSIMLDNDILSLYATYLCVKQSEREKGLAMILIRATLLKSYQHYGINHGYCMTDKPHRIINNIIRSWYRPVNLKKAIEAGYDVQNFNKPGDRLSPFVRQKMAYHIGKPDVLPVKAKIEDYNLVYDILCKGEFYLRPTLSEYQGLISCFDIYIVGTTSLFMLFPITIFVRKINSFVKHAHLTMMIGDALSAVLWAAQESGYDLIYGWMTGDVTLEKVHKIKGLMTISKAYLDYYNTRAAISSVNTFTPLF
jgi:hypothetical protein